MEEQTIMHNWMTTKQISAWEELKRKAPAFRGGMKEC